MNIQKLAIATHGVYLYPFPHSWACRFNASFIRQLTDLSVSSEASKDDKATKAARKRQDSPVELKVKPKSRAKFDYDVTKTDRNYITPVRAMRNYHLAENDLADLPLCLRRSAVANNSVMKVYNIRDVEKKAVSIHGSLEKIAKLEADRLKLENDLKHLKFLYGSVNETKTSQPDKTVVVESIAHKSLGVVKMAVFVNAVNAAGKFAACALSGSSAMFAEAIHSCADTLNQCILLFGKLKSSKKADDEHPYGYSSLQNVTALISGCAVFCLGSGLSYYHGITMFLHPAPVTNFSFSFAMLGFALVTESTTLALAYKHLRASAKAEGQNIFSYIKRSNDPAVNVIFCEDAAAVLGIFIAGGTMALTSITGSPLWDAFGSIGVGTLLAFVSAYIINTNARVLLGQSVPGEDMKRMQATLERDRMVRGLYDVKTTDMGGGGMIRFKAEADFDGREVTSAYISSKVDLEAVLEEVKKVQDVKELEQFLLVHGEGVVDQLGEEVDRLEKKLRDNYPEVRHVDLEVL